MCVAYYNISTHLRQYDSNQRCSSAQQDSSPCFAVAAKRCTIEETTYQNQVNQYMNYQVIALDLDGTLLTPEKTILPASLSALQNARKSGAKVVIVTGRHFVAIHPFYQALELNTPAICCNGAFLYDYIE